ncbi:hypothetical protein ACSDR0_41645 [Streptosporangium sp. G11]|uniref:hypothetical protein n=1 Tax=Streptosporangium sp. G11 TaxID=3436926 RepID=UPI003EBE4ABF
MNMRQKAGLALAASAAVMTFAGTAPAQAAPVARSAPAVVVQTASGSSAFTTGTVTQETAGAAAQATAAAAKFSCSRVKGWKQKLACHAVMKAGGAWVWSKLEKAARGGWARYSEAFNALPRVFRALLWNHKRYFYCLLSPWC